MIASKLCSSSHGNTAYIVTQLFKDIKEGMLPSTYHVVLDEAYTCTEQEMSPWKGRKLSPEKDAFNYYLSLCRRVIERAFGILVQRWRIFWRQLRVSMDHRAVLIRVACKLHNICFDDFGLKLPVQYIEDQYQSSTMNQITKISINERWWNSGDTRIRKFAYIATNGQTELCN